MEPSQTPQGSLWDPTQGETPLRKSEPCTDDGNRQERHGARGATMRRELTRRLTQINGVGHARDIARERQQSPPQKRTRLPPRRSDSDRASNRGTNARKGNRPRKGKDQAEREDLSLTRSLREGTASAKQPTEAPTPAGRKEGRVRKTTPDL